MFIAFHKMILFCISRICLIALLISQLHGYVLFAANLDDFRSIAKKFIPEKLADQLAEMASESSVKYHQKAEEKDAEYESNESEGDVTKPHTTDMPKNIAKTRYVIKNPMPEVNLDELVEKVRERLLEGKNKANIKSKSVQKYKYSNKKVEKAMKTPDEDYEGIDYSQNNYKDNADNKDSNEKDYEELTTKRKPQIKIKISKNDKTVDKIKEENEYPENVKVETAPQYGDDGKIFHEFDLRNANDSYEDYVKPDKEIIFETEEIKTTKRRPVRPKTTRKTNERTKDYDDMKARTESLLYDEREVHVNRTIDGALRKLKTTKKGKGTMIPTRQYYKMSSPDYYKKLPIVAERYDFNEPLPEKDREPENLKPIGNPPARINKKVKV